MGRVLVLVCLAGLLIAPWTGPAPAQPAGPPRDPIGEMVIAYATGDRDALVRRALAVSTEQMRAALTSSDRMVALAAAFAAPHTRSAWLHLPQLAALARSPDRPLAVTAARSARLIASKSEHTDVLWRGIPLDRVRKSSSAFRSIAHDPGRWTDVRVAALETATHLHRQLGNRASPDDAPFDLAEMMKLPDPELRRAAIELSATPLPADQRQLVAATVTADPDPLVAAVAAHVLCEDLVFGGDAAAILAALGKSGIDRLRALMGNRDIPLPSRRGAGRCLAAEGSRASSAALGKLRGGALQ